MDNPEKLQQELLEAQLQLDDGTIDEATFAEIERDVFARLREMKGDTGRAAWPTRPRLPRSRSRLPTARIRDAGGDVTSRRAHVYVYALASGRPSPRGCCPDCQSFRTGRPRAAWRSMN